MRFKLTLQVNAETSGRLLPINYMYELSAAIYKILSMSGEDFSEWLHENGFEVENKKFKLFTFSRLVIPHYEIVRANERIKILSDTVDWYVTFLPEKSTQRFIEGLFMSQTVQIGDKLSSVEFGIRNIEMLPVPVIREEMCFETISPVCISRRGLELKTDYLSPIDPSYRSGILTGLLARYQAFYGKTYAGPLFCNLQLLNVPRSSLTKIKANTPQQTFVRGYNFRFKIQLPETLMRLMYEVGLGEKGSMGFGMVKELTSELIQK